VDALPATIRAEVLRCYRDLTPGPHG